MGRSVLIKGVHARSLTRAWSEVRREIRNYSFRDPIDLLEYDIDPKIWIKRLLTQLTSGSYRPQLPSFGKLAKSNGFTRTITYPAIPDITLFRCLANTLYDAAKCKELPHCYFDQASLAKAQKKAHEEATPTANHKDSFFAAIEEWLLDYSSKKSSRYRSWLEYDQYRKHLIFSKIYPFIVTSDISNYFDSLVHRHVTDTLSTYIKDPHYIRLVELLLQSFSDRTTPRPSDGVGLPVDEADCSRHFAHVLLFPHDRRMSTELGPEAYVRWMDDQNFGVNSKAEALELVEKIQESLRINRLFANTAKTKILPIAKAKKHFHFATNKKLDDLYKLNPETTAEIKAARRSLRAEWDASLRDDRIGNWDKILKRYYLLHGRFKSNRLKNRALQDVLDFPTMTSRILDYMRCRTTITEYVTFINNVLETIPSAYEDVAQRAVESLLRLEPDPGDIRLIRDIGQQLLSKSHRCSEMTHCRAVAPLLFLRYGDKRQLPTLKRIIETQWDTESSLVIRSCSLTYASYGGGHYPELKRIASRNFKNSLADQIMFFDKLKSMKTMPKHLHSRFDSRYDSLNNQKYVDMRSILSLRLIYSFGTPKIRAWAVPILNRWRQHASPFEGALLTKLF